jgi:DNA-binding helix-hairpin-helix protein with protein kinase domain
MNPPKDIRDGKGAHTPLGSMLGKGGEGIVFEVGNRPQVAAKIYHPEKANERAEKVLAMVSAGWYSTSSDVAYPMEALFKTNSKFAGFTMRRVGGRKAVHDLYSPASRKTYFPKANFRFLLRTGLNVSRAIAGVHATGCVVGDINHSGILVAPDATATLIDSDSFQVNAGEKTYLCKVGVPDFTPPELQGKRLDQITRTTNHDAFGLGVMIFNLLFMGRHPFAGRFLGRGEMPMETAIAQFRFAYSARRSETQMEPPPNVPNLEDIPLPLADAFERSFGGAGANGARPKASEWASLLAAAEQEIIACRQSPAHHYFRNARSCPWCRMEQAYIGFVAFVSPVIVTGPTPTSIGQLIAAIRSVPDPGAAPVLSAQMPALTPQARSNPPILSNQQAQRYLAGIFGSVVSLQLFYVSAPGPLLGLAGLIGSAVLALRNSSNRPTANPVEQLRQSWRQAEERWTASTGNEKFLEIKRRVEDEVRQLQNLGAEENARITQLGTKLKEAQLNRFLDNYQIAHARIKGLGTTRKATLRSYGVETAADVQPARIQQISGFGPSITGLLIAWRMSIERKFVFDPRQPINPADIAQIRADVARKKSALEASLQKALIDLRGASSETQTLRNSLKSSAVQIWNRLRQAEADNVGVAAFFGSGKPGWTFAIVSVVALILSSNMRNSSGNKASAPNYSSIPAPAPTPVPANKAAKQEPAFEPQKQSSAPPAPVATPRFDPSAAPNVWPKELPSVVAPPLSASSGADSSANAAMVPLFPSPAPAVPVATPEKERAARSLQNRQDVVWIQERLREAGFLKSATNGNWDVASRAALRDFKVSNGLAADDAFDTVTSAKLSLPVRLHANQSFIGGWSSEQSCPSGIQLEVSSKRASVSSGACEFGSVVAEQGGWRVRANCQVANESWVANIKLNVRADRLVWSSERGTATYFRCR